MTHYVYFIRSTDPIGLIKIGHCKDITNRICTLQTGTGYKLRLMYSITCFDKEEAIALEKELHMLFAYCRRNGEWFTPNKPLRETIALLSTGIKWKDARIKVKAVTKNKWREKKIAMRSKQLREEGQLHPQQTQTNN